MKLKTRLLSLLLCLCLLFALVPHTAPTAEAAGIAGMMGNLLLSRGVLAAVTGISAIGKNTNNTEATALINKWVFGVVDTVTPGLQAIQALSKQMSAFHREVMAELDFIEEKLDRNLSDIEDVLGAITVNNAYDNYSAAWDSDVTRPLEANGYDQVVIAYKTYLKFAGSYMTGSTVTYGGTEIIATEEMVADCRDSFHAALVAFSGASYDSNVHGNDEAGYYDHVLYETNAVDLKVRSSINTLIGNLINASDAPAGSRYLDRAAQVAYAYFPYSEDQAAFVEAAIMKQSSELSMALMAYQEFIGMRTEYCQAKYDALEASGASDEALKALEAQLDVYCAPNSGILDLINGGPTCIHVGGAMAAMSTWLSEPIYISNSDNSYLYLEDYIRATDTDTIILTNNNFSYSSDFDTILAESKAGAVASIIDMMVTQMLIEKDDVAAQVVSSTDLGTKWMEFVRRGVVMPNRNGRATVKPIYLLADPTEDKSGRLVQDLNWVKTPQDLATTSLNGLQFAVPHADYYNLRDGIFSDGNNELTMVSVAELNDLVNNIPLSSRKGILWDLFADVLGEYPAGRELVMITSEGTASGREKDQYYTEYKGVNMLSTDSFATVNVPYAKQSNTSYTVMLAGDDVTYGKLTAETDSLAVSLSGDSYDAATGKTAAASAVTLTVTPTDCHKISRITAQYHEDPTNPAKVTYSEVLVSENTVDVLSYNDDGSMELVYYMPYTDVTLFVESENGHTFSDAGFCPTCGAYEPAVPSSNGHLISNAGQLYWFSAAVRGDMTHISKNDLPTLEVGQTMVALTGTITAPIHLSGTDDPWVPIGTAETPYAGEFDGGDQPITNLKGSLFGYTNGVTLRNIAIEGGTFRVSDDDPQYLGSIVCRLNGISTMTHCYSTALCTKGSSIATGGLVGSVNNGIITDCYFAGSLSPINTSETLSGGLIGSCGRLVMENCSVSGSVPKAHSGGLIGEVHTQATVTNSYYDTGCVSSPSAVYDNTALAPEAAMSNEVYKSGEVAYLLNAGRENSVWYQTIGEQDYPEFTGLQVYHIEDGDFYSNDPDGKCLHPNSKLSQSMTSSFRKHTIHTTCSCGEYTTSVTENCVDKDSDNDCDICGGYLICSHPNAQPYIRPNSDGTHTIGWGCGTCGESEANTDDCSDEDGDGACDTCRWDFPTEPDVELFTLAGCNMTLGNELVVNFMMAPENYAEGQYAVLTHNGVEHTLPLYELIGYYAVSYGIAAKQMADPLTVVIFDADGNAVSHPFTSSVRDYAARALTSSTADDVRIMVVDMLNYGAAAQSFFGYNAEDLANNALTEEQAALASPTPISEDKSHKGENCYGSTLTLGERILLNMFFKNMPDDTEGMYAEISFTDHFGRAQSIIVDDAEFVKEGTPYTYIIVDDIVLADARQMVTMTVYNADGSEFGSCTDSMESYIARANASEEAALYDTILKFADAAYTYLHNR